jgi:hypothetical protein
VGEALAARINFETPRRPARTGYGDGIGKDLRAFIDDVMRADWAVHREVLLAFWISGRYSSELPNTKPWLFYCGAPGTRPWAWWMLEDRPPIDDDESEDEYLTRTKQWLPGERAAFEGGQAEVTMPSSLTDDISQ